MKKILALTLTSVILLVVGATGAMADHKQGHQSPPSCQQGAHAPNQNKHCYPPGDSKPQKDGRRTSFSTDTPDASGLTVGMATLIAVGGVGTLLIVRRRWTFRTSQR